MALGTKSKAALEAQHKLYIKAWNSHDLEAALKFFSEDCYLHWPNSQPSRGREEIRTSFRAMMSVFHETIHPTYVLIGDGGVAMEARVAAEVVGDVPEALGVDPFEEKPMRKGDRLSFDFIVHYEYNEDLQITTFRVFAPPRGLNPGQGILRTVLPGYEPFPENWNSKA